MKPLETMQSADLAEQKAQMQYVISNKTSAPIKIEPQDDPAKKRALFVPPHTQQVLSQATLDEMGIKYEELTQNPDLAVDINYILQNKTAHRIGIAPRANTAAAPAGPPAGDQIFVLPPFGERLVTRTVLDQLDYEPWQQRNLINVRSAGEKPTEDESPGLAALGCSIWVIVFGLPLGLVIPALRRNVWFWSILAGLVIALVLGSILARRRTRLSDVLGGLWQSLSVLLLVATVVGLPGLVAYYFGGGIAMMRFQPPDLPTLGLLGRLMQLTFVAIVSLLPALLYFQFERQQGRTLRESFVRDVMLLDPNVQTTDDVEIKYGRLADETYGTGTGRTRDRYLFSPLFLSTLLMMLGWILTLKLLGEASSIQADTLYTLLIPHPTALNFAFLGAYLFAINLIFRRYVRGDLGPKAYSHITVRILTAVIVAWAISLLPIFRTGPEASPAQAAVSAAATATAAPAATAAATPGPAATAVAATSGAAPAAAAVDPLAGWNWLLFIVAFGIGILPETGMALIQDYTQNIRWIGARFPSLREEHPLTNLEGINLYDRARLLEEGIENVENLAHYNFIDLMLHTRIPVQRLVDLVDQAILYLHVGMAADPNESKAAIKGSDLHTLRTYGIRTATDLQRAYAEARRTQKLADFLSLLPDHARGQSEEARPAATTVERLEVILNTIQDDEWIAYVRNWRELSSGTQRTYLLSDFTRGPVETAPEPALPVAPVAAAAAAP